MRAKKVHAKQWLFSWNSVVSQPCAIWVGGVFAISLSVRKSVWGPLTTNSEGIHHFAWLGGQWFNIQHLDFSVKKRFFSEKGGGNSVNEGFGKDFHRKCNSVKRSGPFSAPPASEDWKFAVLIPSRKSALIKKGFKSQTCVSELRLGPLFAAGRGHSVSTALLLNEVSEKSRENWNEVSPKFFSEICPEIRPGISLPKISSYKRYDTWILFPRLGFSDHWWDLMHYEAVAVPAQPRSSTRWRVPSWRILEGPAVSNALIMFGKEGL